MNNPLINSRTKVLALMILSAGAWRLLISSGHSPFSNFTPVGAMALFGGNYFSDKWKAYLFPLFTLWLSDVLLSYFVYFHEWRLFYGGFLWTYSSFAFMVLIGSRIQKASAKNIVMAGIAAALIHWIISDFGVWMGGRLYPKTWEGLLTCYIAAIPYMKNMLIGNLVFGGIMFGIFESAQRKFPSLQLTQPLHANS
jgi:hypothetical protein